MHGMNVHKAVLAAGEKESGCTVHLVTYEVDAGSVVGQMRVPILPDDTPETLQAKILETEHTLLPLVVQWFAEGNVEITKDSEVMIKGV